MRWIVRGLIGLAGLIVLVLAVVYGGSQLVIAKGHAVPETALTIPTDAASIAEGGRLARVEGCRNCHGPEGKGTVMVDDPMFGRLAPPALARVAANYSDADFARAIRYGVRKDGSSLWGMPTKAYNHIADQDLGKIIAWIRTLKASEQDSLAKTGFGPIGRALVLAGQFPPSVQAENHSAAARPAEVGGYFVKAVCMGCHLKTGSQPSDDGKQTVPGLLDVAPAYEKAEFRKLLKAGQGMTKRDLGMMREVAEKDFSHFSEAEVDAILAWLKAEQAKAPAK
jgi:cytochrome c553